MIFLKVKFFLCFLWQVVLFFSVDFPFIFLSSFLWWMRPFLRRFGFFCLSWLNFYKYWSTWGDHYMDSWYDGDDDRKWYSYKTYKDYTRFLKWARVNLVPFVLGAITYPLRSCFFSFFLFVKKKITMVFWFLRCPSDFYRSLRWSLFFCGVFFSYFKVRVELSFIKRKIKIECMDFRIR